MVCCGCVRSAMLYVSKTWCLREIKIAILRRTERATVRSVCGVKLVNRQIMRVDGNAGFEGNMRSNGQSKWSKLVWTCG